MIGPELEESGAKGAKHCAVCVQSTMQMKIRGLLSALVILLPGTQFAHAQAPGVNWEELTAGDFVKAIERARGTCLLPIGIVEKHGPQLPLGTDLINVRYVSQKGAEQEFAVVFPAYYFGQIFGQNTNQGRSRTARGCNWNCCKRPQMRWLAMAARRFSL